MATEQDATVRVEARGDVRLVSFAAGAMLDESMVDPVLDKMTELIDAAEKPCIVIDFSNVSFVCSSLLSVLITTHRRVNAKNGDLRLAAIPDLVYGAFRITRLDKLIRTHERLEEALASI